MKSLFVTLSLCLMTSAYATNYYFSAVSGNDSRTALEAQNPSTPWKTLNKLNSVFITLNPGDAILLKRGETFYGNITVTKSGTTSAPITIGAYGSGKKPVINSFVKLTGWVSKGNGIWESSDAFLSSTVNMVLINGVPYAMGRYPNKDASNKGYLNFESHKDTTSITDKQLSSSINWTGAELVLRPRHWDLDRDLITAHSGNNITYIPTSRYEPYEHYGYFIQNSIKTLDKFGEWYYDPFTKKFSLYFGSAKPTSYVIEASTIKNVIYSVTFSNVVFDNLIINGANGSGFSIISGSNFTVQNCDILFSGQNGINVVNHTGFKLENCTIINQHNTGVSLEGDNATIRKNKIMNTYLLTGMGKSGNGNGNAISISSSNSLVEYNSITNTGYQGIYFNGSDVTIKNNLIDNYCLVKDDGGGIYSTKAPVIYQRRKVIGNIILNGKGNGYGTDQASKLAAHGFYVDNNAAEIDFRDNTIANCSSNGMNIHNVFGMNMVNNTVYNNKIQLNMIEDFDHAPIRNCNLNNNVLFSKTTAQLVSSVVSWTNDIKSFGKFDNNYYARPIKESTIIYSSTNSSNKVYQSDLTGWKTKYGMDPHSKKTARQLSPTLNPNNYIRFEYNASTSNKTVSLSGSYIDAKGTIYAGKITLKPYTSAVLIKLSGTLSGNIAPSVNLTNPVDNTGYAPNTSLTISADASDDGSVVKVDFYNGSTFLGSSKTSPYLFKWNNVAAGSYIITAKATDNTGNVTSSFPVSITVGLIAKGPPTVTLNSTSNNVNVIAPASINFVAFATAARGSITKVEFFNGTTLLTTVKAAPYVFTWQNVKKGNYIISAKATDNGGLTAISYPVRISVIAPPVSRSSSAQIARSVAGSRLEEGKLLSKSDLSKLANFKVFPNPTSNAIHLYFDGLQIYQKANIAIYNATGGLVKRYPVILSGRNINVDISSLHPGIYTIFLSNDNFIVNKKFVKLN